MGANSPKYLTQIIFIATIIVMSSNFSAAQTSNWTGAGTDDTWLNADNWDTSTPNSASFDVIIGAPAPTDLNFSVNVNSITINPDGILNVLQGQNLGFFGSTAATSLNNAGQINMGLGSTLRLTATVENSSTIFSPGVLEVQDNGVMLTGGGTIEMIGGTTSLNGSSFPVMTIVDQVISGQGNIGGNALGIDIQAAGTIDANSNGDILFVDPNISFGLDNAGQMQASNGGILRLSGGFGGDFNNTGGTIRALAGSEVQLTSGASIVGGNLMTNDDGLIRTIGNGALRDLDFDGLMVGDTGSITQVSGAINNSGVIEITSLAGGTFLEVQDTDVTFDGGGTIRLLGDNPIISGVSFPVLNLVDQTIEGRGNIGGNAIGISVESDSLIDANSSENILMIDPDLSFGLTNAGQMQASNGGILRLSGGFGGEFNNANGTIEAMADSEIQLASGAMISGGQLIASDNGIIRNIDAGGINDLSLVGSLLGQDGTSTRIAGTINNTGSIEIQSTVSGTRLELLTGDATLTGGGTIRLTGSNAIVEGTSNPVLTLEDQKIEGTGNLGNNAIGIAVQPSGLIDANSAGNLLDIDPDIFSGATNSGILQASDGGILRITGRFGGGFDNTGGTIRALEGSEVQFLGNVGVSGGTLANAGSGQLKVTDIAVFADINLTGALSAGDSTTVGIQGIINNSGSIHLASTGGTTALRVQAGNATLTGGGTIALSGNNVIVDGIASPSLTIEDQTIEGFGQLGFGNLAIFNEASGVIDANVEYSGAANGITIDTDFPFTNRGTMIVRNGSRLIVNESLANDGTISISPNALGDALQIQTLFLNSGRLEGSGNIRVFANNPNAAFYNELGVVAPGGTGSIGQLFIFPNSNSANEDAFISGDHELEFEIASATEHDVFGIGGGGTLTINSSGSSGPQIKVTLLDGFVPDANNLFTVLSHNNNQMTGEFANASDGERLVTTDSSGSFEVRYNNGASVQLLDYQPTAFGDVNLDGSVDLLDVAPFIDLLTSGNFQAEADVNQDGQVNLLDVGPFVDILASN